MKKPKVFVARPIPQEVEQFLGQHCEYDIWREAEAMPRHVLLEKLADVEGLLTAGTEINNELLQHAPKLKIVSNVSVGYNTCDLEAMKARNVTGTHTPYVLDDTVADLVIALMLASARRITELDAFVKAGRWEKGSDTHLFGIDVHHATLGIIGMGRIGEAVAKRARFGFDMEVLYHNRRRNEAAEERLGVRYVDQNELLKQSDFVLLMLPLNAQTTGFMDRSKFDLMKPSAIFINASRGQTVNEADLIEVLQEKRIRGAGLDVYAVEPVQKDNPLLHMPHVVTVPHIGSATDKTRFDMAMVAAQDLVKFLKGESPTYVIPELK
jgi:gluconate 2-dehydrogenase